MTRYGTAQRQRKQAVFEAIVCEYEGPLLRYAARILSNENAAQDIVQDTFIRLFRSWKDDLHPGPRMANWLYRVAHNCAVDHIRKESRRRDLHLRHAKERPDSAPPDRGRAFRISEEARQAVDVLRTLSLREQQLVVLKVYEEKSYRDIAEITDLTVSNVGYILHHAMRKMAAAISDMKEQQR